MKLLDYSTEGLPIYYDPKTEEIVYKEHRVLFSRVKEAYNSSFDRVELARRIRMIRTDFGISFGCLELTHSQCKSIIKSL